MKKVPYIVPLLAEPVGGFTLLTPVSMGAMGLAFLLSVAVVWAVVTALVIVKLNKADKVKGFLAPGHADPRCGHPGRSGLVCLAAERCRPAVTGFRLTKEVF